MSSKRIVEYLKIEINKLEKEANGILNDIKLLEYNLKNNTERLEQLLEENTLDSSIMSRSVEKIIHNEEEKIEIKKLKLEIIISNLASKKANLNWIEDDTEE